jgi:hypothetical protein
MPVLLEDLAEETSASDRRAAERLDDEARDLDEQRTTAVAPERLRAKAAESALFAVGYAGYRLAEAEGVWSLALAALCEGRREMMQRDSSILI